MIALDGSAIFAVLLGEAAGTACRNAMDSDEELVLSAGSLTELLIVATGKGVLGVTQGFLAALRPTIVPLTEARARAAADAYRRWGKGFHPAALNFGDGFAYAIAKEFNCQLLFTGGDFAQTDVVAAI